VLHERNVYGVDIGLWGPISNRHGPTTRTLLSIPCR